MGLSLTGAGEVPALDGVAGAGVHPARGLGLVAAKHTERGCQHPWGPLPIARGGSLQHGGLFRAKEWKDRILGQGGNSIHDPRTALSPEEREEQGKESVQ